ncbi:hypothetical protein RM96_35230 [Cupriavidus sp. IDO]|nr:hypothetical protein RM96_35230 [Cupriavidus sp. IDO]
MSSCSCATGAAAWGRQPDSSELLHLIRASVASIRMDAADGAAIERRLSSLLRHALATGSPFDIALVLGSAAELMLFPEQEVLEQCTAAVQQADQQALRGLVWAVRHRSMRGGKGVRRFAVDPQ